MEQEVNTSRTVVLLASEFEVVEAAVLFVPHFLSQLIAHQLVAGTYNVRSYSYYKMHQIRATDLTGRAVSTVKELASKLKFTPLEVRGIKSLRLTNSKKSWNERRAGWERGIIDRFVLLPRGPFVLVKIRLLYIYLFFVCIILFVLYSSALTFVSIFCICLSLVNKVVCVQNSIVFASFVTDKRTDGRTDNASTVCHCLAWRRRKNRSVDLCKVLK